MRAALHRSHGAVDVLEIAEVAEPVVGPADVLVGVSYSALNRLDLLQRAGPALVPGFSLPHVAGMDIAGEVVEAGADVDGFGVGDRVVVNPAVRCGRCAACARGEEMFCAASRVLGANTPGGYAELVAVPATHVHHVPGHVDDLAAATIPTVFSTAWNGLFTTGGLRLGETVLIHAAGSGVSTAAIQLAKHAGATVIATAGTEPKLEAAKRLGADVVVNNRTEDVLAAVAAATDEGVDLVFDHVGPALFELSLHALRPRGRLVFCGVTTGARVSFDLPRVYQRGLRLLGSHSYSSADFGRMLAHCWTARFEAVIDSVYPLDQVAAAHERLASGETIGKVVLEHERRYRP
ncbi:MAG TPA: zinc-binding dehydrogenase [Acidimicrobiales bacterium]|nr:zinc-binding dehydrogenase [Acidimicrobiales bacterium]